MCICMSVRHVYAGAYGGQKRASATQMLQLQVVVSQVTLWFREQNLGLLHELQALLAMEPPPLPHKRTCSRPPVQLVN